MVKGFESLFSLVNSSNENTLYSFRISRLMPYCFQKLISFSFAELSRKDYLLALYGLFNFGLMFYFIGYMLAFHFFEIICFPQKLFLFISIISLKSFSYSFSEISKVLPVIIFYFFVSRILVNLGKKYLKVKKK